MSKGKLAVDKATVTETARIDWRKLLVPSLFIMVLPTISAIVLDKWLGTFPYITIVAIVICFPTATFLVMRIALQEMDRVIEVVAPLLPPELTEAEVAEAEALDEGETLMQAEVATSKTAPPKANVPDAGVELTSSP